MKGQKKCKKCGRTFVPKEKGQVFCSVLCEKTGFFVGGGGDTSKPGVTASPKPKEEKVYHERAKSGDEKYSRVREMFELPIEERWKLAQTFTPEEYAYARRLGMRQLKESDRIDKEWDWNYSDVDDTDAGEPESIAWVEDSDDGSL